MLCFTLNTASRENEILLWNETEIIAHEQWTQNQHEALELPERLKRILKKHTFTWHDLTHISVIRGPGGFTSIRVGVTIANTISYGLKIPISGIALFDWWKQSYELPKDGLLVSSNSSEHIFLKTINSDSPPLLWNTAEPFPLPEYLPQPCFGELIEKHLPLFPEFQSMASQSRIFPVEQWLKHLSWQEKGSIEPLYGRAAT